MASRTGISLLLQPGQWHQWLVETRGQSSLCARSIVRWWLDGPTKMFAHQPVESWLRRHTVPVAHVAKPFGTKCHMFLLVMIDRAQNSRAGFIALLFKFGDCRRGYIQPARFKHQWDDRKACGQIMPSRLRRFPKPGMGWQSTIVRTQLFQATGQKLEVFGFLQSDLDLVVIIGARQLMMDRAGDHVPG